MSQLLFRLSKLSSRNDIRKSVRLFSTSPYLTYGFYGDELPDGGGYYGEILLFDPAKEELLTVRDKRISQELANGRIVGSSHGWGFFHDRSNHSSVHISNLFSPLDPKTNPTMIIPLPPLTNMPYAQTNVVWNVAMSSSSPHDLNEEEDCVVAIKFLGNQLSMCKRDPELGWTNKQIPFICSENSNLMYSKKDQRFYLPAPGGNYLCSWDLNFKNDPKFNELVFRNLPKLPHHEWERLDSCFRDDHWVESPCGQSFLVKWYSHVPSLGRKEPKLMVFREDQETKEGRKNMCYTEDIGDLCIFLSMSDPFCVVASSCPGLKPNSIYITGRSFAVYDLTTKTARRFGKPKGSPETVPFLPFWLPPFSLYGWY